MRLSFIQFIVSTAVVQALPPPATELLESSIEEMNKLIDSLPVLKSTRESVSELKIEERPLAKKQKLDHIADSETTNHGQVVAAMAPSLKPVKESRAPESFVSPALNSDELPVPMRNKKINQKEASPLKKKIVSFGPEVTTHDSNSLLQLEKNLELAEHNAIDSEWASVTSLSDIDEINNMWKKYIKQKANPKKTNLVKFSPSNREIFIE